MNRRVTFYKHIKSASLGNFVMIQSSTTKDYIMYNKGTETRPYKGEWNKEKVSELLHDAYNKDMVKFKKESKEIFKALQ